MRRGIALDDPGLRPIGIGEICQRIEAKAMTVATKDEVIDACGADNSCDGLGVGFEDARPRHKE